MAINYGDLSFGKIEPLSSWDPPSHGGIYAITYRPDYQNKPDTYRIIYFGQTDKFQGRGIDETHHSYKCWKEKAGKNRLYVSIHQDDNDASRKSKEKKLIEQYTPSCNKEFA